MITGTSQADVAILVVAAGTGEFKLVSEKKDKQENTLY
jgi:translation elongation factor EF-1alpha